MAESTPIPLPESGAERLEPGPERPAWSARFSWASVLFVAAALAFLLPFGTVSCEPETVSFTGIELATRTIEPDPAAAGAPDKGLAGDVEAGGATIALMTLVFLGAGLVSVAWRAGGGGFALLALLSLLALLFNAGSSLADIQIGVGYWLALASVSGAGLLRLGSRWRARRRRSQDQPQVPHQGGRLRPPVPSMLLAASAIAVVVMLEVLTTRDPMRGAGSANVDFSTRDYGPVWSPDGRQIAFASNRGPGGIFVVRPDGSCLRRVTAGDQASWSPDGRRLAVTRGEGRRGRLVLVNVDGKRIHVVAKGEFANPQWSADGKRIYVARSKGEATALFVVLLRTGHVARLAPPSELEYGRTVAPDGQSYAFVDGDSIFVRSVGKPSQRRLSNPPPTWGDVEPTWSRDGGRIAFQRYGDEWGGAPGEIAVMAADGSGEHVLTSVDGAFEPAWSPDGKSIVFTRGLSGPTALEIVDVATGEIRKLTWGPGALRSGSCGT